MYDFQSRSRFLFGAAVRSLRSPLSSLRSLSAGASQAFESSYIRLIRLLEELKVNTAYISY